MPKKKKPNTHKPNSEEEKKDKGNLPEGFIRFPRDYYPLNLSPENIPRRFALLFLNLFDRVSIRQVNSLLQSMGLSKNFDFDELMAKAEKYPDIFKKVLELRNTKRIGDLDEVSAKTGESLIKIISYYARNYNLKFRRLVLLDLPSFEKEFSDFKKLHPKIFEKLRFLKIEFDYLVLFKKILSKKDLSRSDFLTYLVYRAAEPHAGQIAEITVNKKPKEGVDIFSPKNVEARIQILLNKHKKYALQHINKFLVNFLMKKLRFNEEAADALAAYISRGQKELYETSLTERLNLLKEENVSPKELAEIIESTEKFIEFFSSSKKPN